jgi:hypothetical protein
MLCAGERGAGSECHQASESGCPFDTLERKGLASHAGGPDETQDSEEPHEARKPETQERLPARRVV